MTAWKSGSEIGPATANLRLHRQDMLTTAIGTNEARTVPLYLRPPAIAKQVDQSERLRKRVGRLDVAFKCNVRHQRDCPLSLKLIAKYG